MTSLIAFIRTLPEFLKLLGQLAGLMNRFLDWSKQQGVNKWLSDLEERMDQLEAAKTPEEKLDAAQNLVKSIRHI